ncbi:MAG: acetyl-CoA C-acyltransferase, partial [Pseudomonadota bacterium]
MTEAYIYDHVRTPRGKGKPSGSLHPITPVALTAQMLGALKERNELDTSYLDDVVLGCVSPVGEQGANIARIGVLMAGYAQNVPGKQLNRFCASGLEAINTAAAQVMSGQSDLTIGGGVECMSRVPMGSDSGAMAADPKVAYDTYFAPQGISADLIASKWGFSRDDVDSYAVESQARAASAWESGYFTNSVVPVVDQLGMTVLDHDEHMRPGTTKDDLANLNPAFVIPGEQAGFDAVALQRYPEVEA